MNIYLVKRTDAFGVNNFAEFVVVAPDEDTARNTCPIAYKDGDYNVGDLEKGQELNGRVNALAWLGDSHDQWVEIGDIDSNLTVELLGTATKEKAYWHVASFDYIEP